MTSAENQSLTAARTPRGSVLRSVCAGLVVAGGMTVTTGAHAQSPALPSFRLSAQSSTVSPSSPELASVYGTPTSPLASAPSARITTLARALENNPDRIYQFVRNTITFEPQFGLHKGADEVLLNGSGGAFDQAQMQTVARQADR